MPHQLIQACGISITRHQRPILKSVSLTIDTADFVTLIGPNGAGKSTLLKCLLGLQKPDQGSIKRCPDLRIAYVPQHLQLSPVMPMSAAHFLSLRRKSSRIEREQVIAETAIESLLHKPLYQLSRGELQRLLMARALLAAPQLLILDEPAQNLDINNQILFYQRIEKIFRQRQLSILMVSHDLHLVMSATRRVICLFQHICCSGSPQMVAKDPRYAHLFGAEVAQMSWYRHQHNHRHDDL